MRHQTFFVTFLLLFRITRGQLVHFTREDFGYLNETNFGFVTLTVEKVGASNKPFSVIIESNGGEDFTNRDWSVSFPVTSNYSIIRTVDVIIEDDNIPEDDEEFIFTLKSTSASVLVNEPSSAKLTVPANDDSQGIVGIVSNSPINVTEKSGENETISILLNRQRGTFKDVAVRYSISRINSTDHLSQSSDVDNDLYPASGEVVFVEGEEQKELKIFVNDDQVPENDEIFQLQLIEGVNGVKLNESSNKLVIVVEENDSPLRFSQKVYYVDESLRFISVTVFRGLDERGQQRIGPDQSVVSVDYEVVGNTATSGLDFFDPVTKIIRFQEEVHRSTLQIILEDDNQPELAENFTIRLLSKTIMGDAIVTDPSSCTVVIEMNDKANGVVSIDFSKATYDINNEGENAFVIDGDKTELFKDIGVIRHGGAFQQISVEWGLTHNDSLIEDDITVIKPTFGKIYLNENSTKSIVELDIEQNDIPSEATVLVFRLIPSSLSGGAEFDSPSHAYLILADTNDVYGVFSINVNNSLISIDENRNERQLLVEIVRSGGKVGKVNVQFSSLFIPYGEEEGIWGVLEQNNGNIIFLEGEESRTVKMKIKEDAFLQLNSHFIFQLNTLKLVDRETITPPKTPRMEVGNMSLLITPTLANGEVGFEGEGSVYVDEPADGDQPLVVILKLYREGLSGDASIDISYKSLNLKEADEDIDFIPGAEQVSILPGESEVEIIVQILPDRIPELEEVIVVRLDSVSPNNQKLKHSLSEKRIIIQENDNPGGIFQFAFNSIKHYEIQEEISESVTVTIEREEGDLATRFVQCDIIPDGKNQFRGIPHILVFVPGKRAETIPLIPRDDQIPELDQNFTVVLRAYGETPSVVGARSSISVTILANDEPEGVIEFERGNEDEGLLVQQTIGESKGSTSFVATFLVKRKRGTFGHVTVDWRLWPFGTNDVTPSSGTLEFTDGQSESFITLQSVADNIPEAMEEFIIILNNATMGASIGQNRNASLIIKPNDKAIYFKGASKVKVHEDDDLVLTVHREATGSDQTSLRFKTFILNNDSSHVPATPGADFSDITADDVTGIVTFPPGVLDVRVSLQIFQDDFPEDDEMFYVQLFNSRGDYVTYGNTLVEVTIAQNDNANGVFKLDKPYDVTMTEGTSHPIKIVRSYGEFGDVQVHWKIIADIEIGDDFFANVNQMEASDEFSKNEGFLSFMEGQRSVEVFLTPNSDSIPEYDEHFLLVLLNASNGKPRLSSNESELVIRINIEMNDYPHGLISLHSQHVEVAEDVEVGDADGNTTTVEVERRMGRDGIVKVLWEIYPSGENPVSVCKDLLLVGLPQGGAVTTEGRPHVETFAIKFQAGSYVVVNNSEDYPILTNDGFTFTFWIKLDQTGFGESGDFHLSLLPLLAKFHNQTFILSIVIETDTDSTIIRFKYRSNVATMQTLLILLDRDVNLFDAQWHHLVVAYNSNEVILYVDGEQRGNKKTMTSSFYDVTGNDVVVIIGAEQRHGNDETFQGLLQDVRVYSSSLSPIQIRQLFHNNAHYDVIPSSGYLNYGPGEVFQNITITGVDENETENNESFNFVLLDSTGGAEVGKDNLTSEITVLKSDNANGLFGFAYPCQPDHVTEGESVICYISRSLGSHGDVTVHWQTSSNNDENKDFVNFEGKVEFFSGERQKSIELFSKNDDIPELDEIHNITIVKTLPHDGVRSSAPYSGASVDKSKYLTFVTIRSNDKPHGVLQFSDKKNLENNKMGKIIELKEVPIVYVTEESDHVTLMVERAAGWFGHVTVEWRTRDGSATSQQEPRDYESVAGTLSFESGQGHAFIDVRLLNDEMPELEKYFFVILSSPSGGASLNNASRIKVFIKPSDDAFGVFHFNKIHQEIEVEEPHEGAKDVKLEIVRDGGDLGECTVSWRIVDDTDNDVSPHKGQLQLFQGQRSAFIEVKVLPDKIPEFDEIKQIELTNVSHGTVGKINSAFIKILANDDPRGHLVFMPTSVVASENKSFANLTVQRLGGSAGTIRVYYATIDTFVVDNSSAGIAVCDVDFTNVSDSILIHENSTTSYIIIPIIDDVTPETEEVFFVQLLSAELVSSGSTVPNSPRVGSDKETLAEVIILENDSPHGVLELSDTSIRVDENVSDSDVTMGFIKIVRKLGAFGEVSVGVNVIPGTARSQEDYNLMMSQVTLLDGETTAELPLHIVDDFTPELAEDFTVELLPASLTGGATFGVDMTCHVTIEQSDDPYGVLEISVEELIVDEPQNTEEHPITFTVNRRNGLRSVVAARWMVFVEAAYSAASLGSMDPGAVDDGGDVDVRDGIVNFISNETSQQFIIKIQGDDIPEDDEVIRVQLMEIVPTYQGRIDRSHDEVSVMVKANDRPYGDVIIADDLYQVQEIGGDSVVTLRVLRRGGLYGRIRVVYSTSEVDVVSEMLENGQDLLLKFLPPKLSNPLESDRHIVDVTSSDDPLTTCAESCLREKVCGGFFYAASSYECYWITQNSQEMISYIISDDVTRPAPHLPLYYSKDEIQASYLYKSQAKSGMDFIPITGASSIFEAGQDSVDISINIMDDSEAELNEHFKLQLLSVEVLGVEVDKINVPLLLNPSSSRITILENDHPYGMFVLRSSNPDAGKMVVEVEEREHLSLEMVIERRGGSVGEVTVDWIVAGGSASRNHDFTGDDATLKFSHGETSKVISLAILDDNFPEPNEDIKIQLINPSGGAIVSSNENQTLVVILANDKVGGIVEFSPESRSLIGQEGQIVTLSVVRSEPAYGSCEVKWSVHSVNGHSPRDGLNATMGSLLFESGMKREIIVLYIKPDNTPEVKEVYTVSLTDAKSLDIAMSGGAEIHDEMFQAQISIEDSDDPHGVFEVSPTSQRINIDEDVGTISILVSRQFGSFGRVRVHYDIIAGTLSTLNPDINVAIPGRDFSYNSDESYVEFEDGMTSLPIVMQIINDDIPELNEIFHVNLTKVSIDDYDVTHGFPPKIDEGNSIAQVVIDANDGTKGIVGFDKNSVKISVDETTEILQLSIRRDRGTYGAVSVFVFTQNREALIQKDYQCQAETVHFSDGQDIAVYNIKIIDDETAEGAETFEVLLGNPSDGLKVGNATKAIVTITSNDDAHGRLAFTNAKTMYITEPEYANVSNSRLQLSVTRLPLDGVFGQVSVQFKIEPISPLSDDFINSEVVDLIPREGYIVMEDGVGTQVVDIAAVGDNIPELQECFRVILFNPQQGASLNSSGTVTNICVDENDAPYGQFVVVPSNARNDSCEYKVSEANRVINLDIMRMKGDLGTVTVEVSTLPGSSQPFPTSASFNPSLNPFQTFRGSGGIRFHHFKHKHENYLMYLTDVLVRPLMTTIGGSGDLASLTHDVHSTLYIWRGVYHPVQTIETDGASAATSFVKNGIVYIFICNSGERGRRETNSRLYKLSGKGKLFVLQDVRTRGATSASAFSVDKKLYLFLTNSEDDNHVSGIDSMLFRFDEHTEMLQQAQTVPTRGAADSDVFEISGYQYLVVANRLDSEVDSPVSSVIYKWENETSGFTQRQILPVSHARDVVHYHTSGKHFVVVSHRVDKNPPHVIDAIEVFQVLVNDQAGHVIFRPHQSLTLPGVNKLQILTTSKNIIDQQNTIQEMFVNKEMVTMLFASGSNLSTFFMFNHQSQLFVAVMETFSTRHILPHVIHYDSNPLLVVGIATDDLQSQTESNFQEVNVLGLSGVYDIISLNKSTAYQGIGDYLPIRNGTSLVFEPGVTKMSMSLTLVDDVTPEMVESFKVILSNRNDPRAVVDENRSCLNVIIKANDDAFGVVGFVQSSLKKEIEETEEDNVFTLNVRRHKSKFGVVVVDWNAMGAIHDISPVSGKVRFDESVDFATIQLNVLADDQPEIDEDVFIVLSNPRVIGTDSSSSPPQLNSTNLRSHVVILSNDSPHGVVSWSSKSLRTVVREKEALGGASQLVTLEMIRRQGALGDIQVYFKTLVASNLPEKSQATPGVDFIERDDHLVMRENSTRAAISISIFPDDLAEDIETFYVVISHVSLIGNSEFSTGPGLGPPGDEIAEITIDENDNSRGFVQFNVSRNSEGAIEAYELPRVNNTLKIPLVRIPGLFRAVGVDWVARPETAKNLDFFPSSGSVQFIEGVTSSYIEMFIADDEEVEFVESFTVQLVGASGGAQLGGDLKVSVNILPNDSPSGMFGFIKLSQRLDESTSADDPNGRVEFKVERFQGSSEDVTLLWELEDAARMDLTPVSGKLLFPAQVRSRSIGLRSLPDQIMEGEEEFSIHLVAVTGGAEISPVAGVAKVVINADSGSAGRVSFVGCGSEIVVDEDEGKVTEIKLARGLWTFGRVGVQWQIIPTDTKTFVQAQGEVIFEDKQNETFILIETIDDEIPEISSTYDLHLISAKGGGEIEASSDICRIKVRESDHPHGKFTLSQPVYYVKEGDRSSHTSDGQSSSYAIVTILRNKGHIGEVTIGVRTWPGSAVPNVDYYPIDTELIFADGENHKIINIEIIDDNIPEGPNDFYVNITGINFDQMDNGISGDSLWSVIHIDKSDGAEGRVKFGKSRLEINEDVGFARVPLVRSKGSYGSVSVVVTSLNQTAQRNVDFLLPSSGLVIEFEDGQVRAEASIPIVNDERMEDDETFTLALSSPQGGISLENPLITEIVIKKSDYPNGLIQFVGEKHVTISNPGPGDGAVKLTFFIERRGGNKESVTARWRLLRTAPFIMPTTSSSSLDEDINRPHTGSFSFADGEGGQREINVAILPHDGDEEVQESFVISIEDYFPAEISQKNGNALIVVEKKGNPNGVVSFRTSNQNMLVKEPDSGVFQLVFPIVREFGVIGDVNISWTAEPVNIQDGANVEDLEETKGHVLIYNGQNEAELIVNVKEDSEPEVLESFQVRLMSVLGGAELHENNMTTTFGIQENDFPHGIFGVFSSNQLMYVDDNMKRLLRVNVTRLEGTFGQVAVGFKVESMDAGVSYLTTNTGSVSFASTTKWSVGEILIRSSANIAVSDKFIIELTSVEFLNGHSSEVPPSISKQYSKTSVRVPPDVGNPQVGFFHTVVHVTDVSRGICTIEVTRTGLYGSVMVHWSSGYPVRRVPLGVTQGRTLPSSGVFSMDNLQPSTNFTLKVLQSSNDAFALSITHLHTVAGGGASVMSHRDMTEIEPCGAIRFAGFSQRITVSRNQRKLNLTVERLFGSRYDIIILYTIKSDTARIGHDFAYPVDGVIRMEGGKNEAMIEISLIESSVPEQSKKFFVNLTTSSQPQDIYAGRSPRIIREQSISEVKIAESTDVRGVFSFSDVTIRAQEDQKDNTQVLVLMLKINRQVGTFGEVGVIASTFGGGEGWQDDIFMPRSRQKNIKKALAGLDYEERQTDVQFQDGQTKAYIPLVILDDNLPEPDEVFFIRLHSATGGARVDSSRAICSIIIEANDLPNGMLGFAKKNFVIDEDSPTRSVKLKLTRKHAYGDAIIQWRAIKSFQTLPPDVLPTNSHFASGSNESMQLAKQLEFTTGTLNCQAENLDCYITITLKDDNIAEFSNYFYVVIHGVSEGAGVDELRNVANVTVLDSDSPHGKFQFALSSRLVVVAKGRDSVTLTIERLGGTSTPAIVEVESRQLQRVVSLAGLMFYPAVADLDFHHSQQFVEFRPGQTEVLVTIDLVSTLSSANPFPQMFQVHLDLSNGESEISKTFHTSNVTIIESQENNKFWAAYQSLQQNLDDSVIQNSLKQLHGLIGENLNHDQVRILHECLNQFLKEGKKRRLSDNVLQEMYTLFCQLLDPQRLDAVHGYFPLSTLFDEFALILLTESDCMSSHATTHTMDTCSYATVKSSRSYPQLINGLVFHSKDRNFFQLPSNLLNVEKHGVGGSDPKCFNVYFVDYSSQLWFEVAEEIGVMGNKIFSVGIDSSEINTLSSPVRYRIYTKDLRISPKGAECVLWNEASSRWLSGSRDMCHVIDDTSNFVECECHHMSVYAARGPTDNLAGYNEATYAACFIVMVGALLSVLSHHFCSKQTTFATKLLIHMLFACAITQFIFVVAALVSKQLNVEGCAALAITLHYFWLAQFTWIFMQSINILQVLVLNNENTHRLYVVHFVLGWGFPAIIILLYVMIMYALGSKSLQQSYGDVYQNGDICMIRNLYGALLGAVAPAFLCLVAPFVVGLHLYQSDGAWKQYDDIFKGRYNASEVPLLFCSFFLIAITWLFGGIHLGFGQMWMLVLFVIFNFFLGFFLLVTYGILHNELVRSTKAVYEESPKKIAVQNDLQSYPELNYGTSASFGSHPPSVSGLQHKTTQSFEERWDEGGDEDAEFDDLMFALNNGSQEGLDNIEETKLASSESSLSSHKSVRDPQPLGGSKGLPLPIHDTHL